MKTGRWLVLALLGLLAMGSAAQTTHTDDAPAMLARFAVLLGDHAGKPGLAQRGEVDTSAEELLTWDYQRDNAELERLFGLETIHTLQLGSAQLPAGGGRFSSSSAFGASELSVRARVELQTLDSAGGVEPEEPGQLVVYHVQIWRDDEILSAPTVTTVLGDRAIVTTGLSEEPAILWVVLQADLLPLGE